MGIDHKSSFIFLSVVSILICLVVSVAYPASETIFASYKYTMGDNDTKNDAKRICFLEAKRLAIEKAGTYIESSTEIKNFNLTRNEIQLLPEQLLKLRLPQKRLNLSERIKSS